MKKAQVQQSKPAAGARIYDLTDATISVDVENSLGEKYHFEITPLTPEVAISRPCDAPGKNGKRIMNVICNW